MPNRTVGSGHDDRRAGIARNADDRILAALPHPPFIIDNRIAGRRRIARHTAAGVVRRAPGTTTSASASASGSTGTVAGPTTTGEDNHGRVLDLVCVALDLGAESLDGVSRLVITPITEEQVRCGDRALSCEDRHRSENERRPRCRATNHCGLLVGQPTVAKIGQGRLSLLTVAIRALDQTIRALKIVDQRGHVLASRCEAFSSTHVALPGESGVTFEAPEQGLELTK